MPRYPRKYSKTGIYHIMLRGNERKDIFIDEEDKEKFIKTVIKKKANKNIFWYKAGICTITGLIIVAIIL